MRVATSKFFSDPRTLRFIILKIGKIVRTEMKKLSTTDSVLCSQSTEDLKDFRFERIYDEIKNKAPFLHSIFLSATKTRTPRCNQVAIVCLCFSILLRYRFKRLNLFQKIVSLILYTGHSSKMVSVYFEFTHN